MEIKKENITMREVTVNDIDRYYYFIESIKKEMEHPEWLGDIRLDVILNLLGVGAHTYVFEYGGAIIGSSFIIPAREEDIEKFGLNYDAELTIDYGPQAVHEIARGNGIQVYMNEKMDEISRELGYKHVVTTVHPDNEYSIQNILKCGFKYVNQKEFARGIRNIYTKDI